MVWLITHKDFINLVTQYEYKGNIHVSSGNTEPYEVKWKRLGTNQQPVISVKDNNKCLYDIQCYNLDEKSPYATIEAHVKSLSNQRFPTETEFANMFAGNGGKAALNGDHWAPLVDNSGSPEYI